MPLGGGGGAAASTTMTSASRSFRAVAGLLARAAADAVAMVSDHGVLPTADAVVAISRVAAISRAAAGCSWLAGSSLDRGAVGWSRALCASCGRAGGDDGCSGVAVGNDEMAIRLHASACCGAILCVACHARGLAASFGCGARGGCGACAPLVSPPAVIAAAEAPPPPPSSSSARLSMAAASSGGSAGDAILAAADGAEADGAVADATAADKTVADATTAGDGRERHVSVASEEIAALAELPFFIHIKLWRLLANRFALRESLPIARLRSFVGSTGVHPETMLALALRACCRGGLRHIVVVTDGTWGEDGDRQLVVRAATSGAPSPPMHAPLPSLSQRDEDEDEADSAVAAGAQMAAPAAPSAAKPKAKAEKEAAAHRGGAR